MCSLIFVYFNNYNQMYSLSVMASAWRGQPVRQLETRCQRVSESEKLLLISANATLCTVFG